MTIYSDLALDHFDHPRHSGALEDAASGQSRSAAWGDRVQYDLKCSPDGRISDIGWRCSGGVAAIACASLLSERVYGINRVDAAKTNAIEIADMLELPVNKRFAALLVKDALMKALDDWNNQHA